MRTWLLISAFVAAVCASCSDPKAGAETGALLKRQAERQDKAAQLQRRLDELVKEYDRVNRERIAAKQSSGGPKATASVESDERFATRKSAIREVGGEMYQLLIDNVEDEIKVLGSTATRTNQLDHLRRQWDRFNAQYR